MPLTVGDQVGRIIGAPAGSTVMHQNVAVAEAIVLSCFRPVGARNRVVYERGNFPSVRYLYQAQPELDVVVCRRRRGGCGRARRADAARPDHPRALQDRRDPGRRLDRASRARGGRPRRARRVPVGRDRPARRHGARRRLRGRRVGEVALRRAGKRLALRPARSRRAARADLHGLAGPRAAVRVRAGARVRRRRGAVPHRDAERAGAVRRDRRLRRRRGGRRGGDPRALAAPDRASDRAPRRARLRGLSARARSERRGGTVVVNVPEFEAVHRELSERQIICDFRPEVGLRFGPHFFSTEDELRFTVEQIADIVATGAYERHLGAAARF